MLRSAPLVLLPMLVISLCASPAFADDGHDEVSVAVLGHSLITLPPETALTLSPAAASLTGSTNQIDAFVFGHNGADGLRITMTASADLTNLPNDISLELALNDLAPQICVDRGTPLTDIALPASLPPGGCIGDLLWSADATTAATPSGSYAWMITITSTDM